MPPTRRIKLDRAPREVEIVLLSAELPFLSGRDQLPVAVQCRGRVVEVTGETQSMLKTAPEPARARCHSMPDATATPWAS